MDRVIHVNDCIDVCNVYKTLDIKGFQYSRLWEIVLPPLR